MDFDKLLEEGQEFLRLRKEFKASSNPGAGSVGYLISLEWINKYKKYVYYDQLRRNVTPEKPASENDVVPHPG